MKITSHYCYWNCSFIDPKIDRNLGETEQSAIKVTIGATSCGVSS
jgi:aromatic ring hydroxylase